MVSGFRLPKRHTVSMVLSLSQQSSCVSLSPKYTGKQNFMCFRNLPSGCSCSLFSRPISATADRTEIISFPLSFELSIPSSTQIRFTPKSCILCKEFKTSAALRPNLESLNTSTNCTSSVPFSKRKKQTLEY